MRNAQYIVYDSVDELRGLFPKAARYFDTNFQNYQGGVYKFLDFEDFGIYEVTEGSYAGVINFDSPDVRPIHLEDAIDYYELGHKILEAGLKNVIYSDGWIYVLPDME